MVLILLRGKLIGLVVILQTLIQLIHIAKQVIYQQILIANKIQVLEMFGGTIGFHGRWMFDDQNSSMQHNEMD